MDRRIGLGAGVLALALGASLGTGVAAATSVPVTLSGALSCSIAGGYHFGSPLTNAGGTQSTVTLKAKLSSCTGPGTTNGTVTVTTGHLVATSTTTVVNSFGGVTSGQPLPVLTGTITWRAHGGKVNTSTVSITGQAISYDSGAGLVSLYFTPVLSGGSYSGQKASTAGTTATSGIPANLAGLALSAKAAHGVKTISFGKNGGTFTIGAAA